MKNITLTHETWKIVDSDFELSDDIQIQSEDRNICIVYGHTEKSQATAKLIKAAPAMLAALQNLVDRDLITDAYDRIAGNLYPTDYMQEVLDAIQSATETD